MKELKMNELKKSNLAELSDAEIKSIDGGCVQIFFAAVLAGIIDDWAGFKSSFMAGLNAN